MKGIIVSVIAFSLYGCANKTVQESTEAVSAVPCIGTTELPAGLENQFNKISDPVLLNQTLGKADKGKLCQGQVYQSKKGANVTLFRAWNSTNAHSKMGNWWAFDKPTGSVAKYRENYEICYQWSPLDKLVSCTLEAGQKVVVGTGQSTFCSNYLSYPVSAEQQIYLVDASSALSNCTVLNGEFSWK